MNAAAFLSELRRRDIEVSAVGGQLRCIAKTGELTPELRDQLKQWKDDILKLLASAQHPGTVTVRIGEENEAEEMRSTSVLTVGYGGGTVLGGMGVVEPTRMDYPGSIAAVHAVARYVGEILAGR